MFFIGVNSTKHTPFCVCVFPPFLRTVKCSWKRFCQSLAPVIAHPELKRQMGSTLCSRDFWWERWLELLSWYLGLYVSYLCWLGWTLSIACEQLWLLRLYLHGSSMQLSGWHCHTHTHYPITLTHLLHYIHPHTRIDITFCEDKFINYISICFKIQFE